MNFAYEIRDSTGHAATGVLSAPSQVEAAKTLRSDGNTVLSIREDHTSPATAPAAPVSKIGTDDIVYFCTQLAVMVDTGVPLADALDAIVEQTEHTGLKKLVGDVGEDVKAGMEFSVALAKHPKHFGSLFLALMQAAEASGSMGAMLQRASEYMQQERETRRRVKGAMTYPACMLAFCVLVIIGLLIFILPRFEKIYEGKGAVLPAPTRILLGFSDALVNYWPAFLGGLIAAIAGTWFYIRTPAGRVMADQVRLHLPLMGSMYRKSYLSRSLRILATMLNSGVNMLDALTITAGAAGNHFYKVIWDELAEGVKEGSTLSEELRKRRLIPRTVSQMIAAGEKTGKLGPVMNRVAQFCEDDLNTAVKTVTSMIEPAMIIIMGIIVGGIAMALLLPVFSLSKMMAN